MFSHEAVQRITIVGTGTIGASWATHYLARGFDVTATDPAPGAEAALRSYVDGAWQAVAALGLAHGAAPERLTLTGRACASCAATSTGPTWRR
jgi:carnitine 3-dehydrogenase